jgi:hypothetical protein
MSATLIETRSPPLSADYVTSAGYLSVYVTLSFNGVAFTDVSYTAFLSYYTQVCRSPQKRLKMGRVFFVCAALKKEAARSA